MRRRSLPDPPRPLVQVVDAALPVALFRALRRGVTALGSEGLRRTYQTTFWFDLSREPAALPELAVRALAARFRATGARGVEWWLSRMWTHDVRVDFHRDRDERLALAGGPDRHPRVSSVLFLNAVQGGALAVTAQRPDPGNPALVPLPLEADLVAPRPNRLVLFPGRLTHGVLDARNQVPAGRLHTRGELRLTLVMNGWARRPTDVPTFQEGTAYRDLGVRRRRAHRPSAADARARRPRSDPPGTSSRRHRKRVGRPRERPAPGAPQ